MSWEDIEAELHANAESLNALPSTDPYAEPRILQCPDCSRPVLADNIEHHGGQCIGPVEQASAGSQQRRQSVSPQKKRRLSDTSTTNASPKKLKPSPAPSNALPPSTAASPAPLADKSANAKPAAPVRKLTNTTTKKLSGNNKTKVGPMDPNTQCCVLNDNHTPCSRALTCKSHGIHAKRSVPGRTAPFDVLLKEWNEKHNPALAMKKMGSKEGGEKPVVEEVVKKRKKDKKKENESSLVYGEVSDSDPHSGYEDANGDSGLDSEEEVEAVLSGMNSRAAQSALSPFPGLTNPFQSAYLVKDVRISRYRESLAGAIISHGKKK